MAMANERGDSVVIDVAVPEIMRTAAALQFFSPLAFGLPAASGSIEDFAQIG
jgi:hypothetical protein